MTSPLFFTYQRQYHILPYYPCHPHTSFPLYLSFTLLPIFPNASSPPHSPPAFTPVSFFLPLHRYLPISPRRLPAIARYLLYSPHRIIPHIFLLLLPNNIPFPITSYTSFCPYCRKCPYTPLLLSPISMHLLLPIALPHPPTLIIPFILPLLISPPPLLYLCQYPCYTILSLSSPLPSPTILFCPFPLSIYIAR